MMTESTVYTCSACGYECRDENRAKEHKCYTERILPMTGKVFLARGNEIIVPISEDNLFSFTLTNGDGKFFLVTRERTPANPQMVYQYTLGTSEITLDHAESIIRTWADEFGENTIKALRKAIGQTEGSE